MANSDMGDEVYQPDESEVQDDAGVLEPEDTLVDRGVDNALDEGYSPPEKPLGAETYGTTAAEQAEGEPLDDRLSREAPDAGDAPPAETVAVDERDDEDMIDDEPDEPGTARAVGDGTGEEPTDEEFLEAELEGQRAGRLVAPDEGAHGDEEKAEVGRDVGIDGAAASAEEAAVHIVPEPGADA